MQTKAFTIMELLVGMTVTALIVSLALFGLNLFQKQYLQLSATQEKIWDLDAFLKVIQQDAFLANKAQLNAQRLELELQNRRVAYDFQNNQVLRTVQTNEELFQNTFDIKSNITESYFQRKYQTDGWVDQCKIEVDFFGELQELPIHIWYDAQTYLHEH